MKTSTLIPLMALLDLSTATLVVATTTTPMTTLSTSIVPLPTLTTPHHHPNPHPLSPTAHNHTTTTTAPHLQRRAWWNPLGRSMLSLRIGTAIRRIETMGPGIIATLVGTGGLLGAILGAKYSERKHQKNMMAAGRDRQGKPVNPVADAKGLENPANRQVPAVKVPPKGKAMLVARALRV